MIGVIIVITLLAILLYVAGWCEIRKNTKDIDDLSIKYFIGNDSIRDLKTRIRFLEMEGENKKARQALPEAESESCEI